jgi:hypothetical protein
MRRTFFTTFISIAFAAVVGSAAADDVSKQTSRQQAKRPSPSHSWRVVGCGVQAPVHFSACPADDRKCEVASKMRGCVVDDTPGRKRGASGF